MVYSSLEAEIDIFEIKKKDNDYYFISEFCNSFVMEKIDITDFIHAFYDFIKKQKMRFIDYINLI